ncbi:MAG: hypothetical protein JXA71_04580, partial [Chitinispirillaceae bacterium]|nr:hypothetical protein [Chitinispirillaceae bacterium]
ARLSDDTVSINDTVRIAITVNNANPGLASFRIRYTTIPDTLWDLNIAQPDTILTPFFIPRDSLASGMVTVESTDQAGMKTLATMPYTVCLDRPEASILYSPDTLVSINDTITLSDQTVNRFGKYEKKWIVRDTVLADTSRSIKVICTVAGTIPCSLSVIDDDGLRAAAGIRIHVRSFPPVAVATANADTVWGGDTIKLTTAGSHDSNAGGVIREYAWRFGLGGSNWKVVTAGDTIIAAQPERGTQCAVLRVTDDDGEIGYDTVKVEIFLKFIYVDSACINSLSRGNSWDTAMTDLQKALFNAKAGTTIRIAKGTYYPTKNGDRNISFELKSGVTLVGCYPNGGGIRDTALYPTILSGDIDSNSNLNGNSYHVIIAKNVDSTAIIDGITIYLGNADGNAEQTFGGGMFSLYSSPKIMNCRITNCYAKSNGGAMYNESSEPFILNTVFIHDSAITSGGAIYNKNASPKLFGCTFTNNYTTENGGAMYNDFSELLIENTNFIGDSSTAWGGAIYNKSSSVHINNCKFTDNRTNTYGGAMYNESSTIELLNSIFQNNHVDTSLPQKAACGGALYNVNSLLKIDSCSFASNYCSKDGGALYNSNSELKMTNCSLSINQALSTGGGISADSAPATFINCIFSDNYSGSVMGVPSGGGIYIGGSPLITNCTFTQNTAIGGSAHNRYGSGGGASINGSPILTNCIFADNYSGRNGGGLYITGSPTITNCSFTKNTSHSGLGSSSKGGGLYIEESAIISKCTFLNNICEGSTSTGRGGGIYIHGFLLMNNSTFTKNTVSGIRSFGGALHMNGGSLINCTFTQNTANTGSSSGGAVFDSGSTSYKSTLLNCLFWGDSASSSPEYYNDSNLTPTLKNCIIQNGYTGPGTLDSIFTFDPQLDSLRDNGGPVPTCAIPANSPARNAGTSNIPAGIDISTDARGMPRSDGKPDIGAYEVQ